MNIANPPLSVSIFLRRKAKKNENGGRPHFLTQLKKAHRNPIEEALEICSLAWQHDKPTRLIARRYHTLGFKIDRSTITRLLNDLEPWKEDLIKHLEKTPRKRAFYNSEVNTSDYGTIQNYIQRGKRFGLRNYKRTIKTAERCYKALGYKNPENWIGNEVHDYLATLPRTMQSNMLDAVRAIAPQLADRNSPHYIPTGAFREKIGFRKKHLFGEEVKVIRTILIKHKLNYQLIIFDLHITLGCREGSTDTASGITGLCWDRFRKNFHFVDDYECKTRHGVWWRNCPTDIFFSNLPERLRNFWKERGKSNATKLVIDGYKGLTNIYKQIRTLLKKELDGKVEPSLYKEYTTLRPHDADKIHCNLLWEAGTPLEVVCGEYLGHGEGIGLVGRGWQNDTIVKRHYLSLTQRSEKFMQLRQKINIYSRQFNGR